MDKKLGHNFLFNLVTQLLTVLTPLIISPYISRVFDANLIGDYNYCYAIVSIFGVFANMGISIYGVPIIAKCKDTVTERSKAFFELLVIKTIFFQKLIPAFVESAFSPILSPECSAFYRLFCLMASMFYLLQTFPAT